MKTFLPSRRVCGSAPLLFWQRKPTFFCFFVDLYLVQKHNLFGSSVHGATQTLRVHDGLRFWRKNEWFVPAVLQQEAEHAADSSGPRAVPAGLREWDSLFTFITLGPNTLHCEPGLYIAFSQRNMAKASLGTYCSVKLYWCFGIK